jgi:hypothetical protein
VFLTIFQVLPCEFLIFFVGQFSCHNPGPTLFISHFLRFSVFLAIFQLIHCLCLIFHVFQFSHHNPGPTVYVSPFSCFSLFIAIILVQQCVCLIFLVFQFSCLILGDTVYISHYSHFSGFSPFSRSYRKVFFHKFQCFSLYSRSSQVIYSFSILVRFLAILLVLQGALLIFDIFQ